MKVRAFVRREGGAGSVLVLSIVMVAMAMLAVVGMLAGGYRARHQAAAAADLAALAAAEQLASGVSEPCVVAEEIAVANGAELHDCMIDGMEVEVRVRVGIGQAPGWLPDQFRRARAGPG